MSYKLAYRIEGRRQDHRLEGQRVTVGRDPENDLVIEHLSVSRFHARLERRGDQWSVVDTRSRNGVTVNGRRIEVGEAQPLSDGDTVGLGAFPLEFTRDEREKLVLADEAEESQTATSATIRPVTDFKDLVRPSRAVEALPGEAQEVVKRAERVLGLVTAIGQRVVAVKPLEEVIESIIDLVFESTPAERAALLLWDDTVRQLVPKTVRARGGASVGEIRVSRSIVSKAFGERCVVQLDPTAAPGESIVKMGLRSAVAVPLWDQTKVIGVIYADSTLRVGVLDAFTLALLSALANFAAIAIEQARLLLRLQQEERAREKLGRYHSPAVVGRILASADSSVELTVAAQETDVTVLFADMVDFTSTSEGLSPQEVMILLNQYFSRLTEVIFEHEGTLDKFIGDCVMAVFGAPLSQPDHARRAALAALAMRQVVRETNQRRSEGKMDFRIGLNSGPAVSGDVGSARRKEWTVLGSTVNLAARMQSSAVPGSIWMTENTRRLLGEEFEVRSLGRQRPKGLRREIEVFELVGSKADGAG